MNIDDFLSEDKAENDVTTREIVAFLGKDPTLEFELLAKEDGVFSGKRWLEEFQAKGFVEWKDMATEGEAILKGKIIAKGSGPASKVLSVERTMLNGLQYLCGIATRSTQYVQTAKEIAKKKNMPAPAILHTRKIHPGLRDYVADALSSSGVGRHRFTLADRMLVKDNHVQLLKTEENLRAFVKSLSAEKLASALFEADTEAQVALLVESGVKHVMLDNFSRARLEKLLPTLPKNVIVEVSGGIQMDNLEQYILPGVHRISVGALTHRAKSLDISLEATILD